MRTSCSLLAAVLAVGACAPQTDLTSAGPGADPSGATAGTLVDPLAGAADVPVNLMAVTLRFAAPVMLPASALAVCGQAPAAIDEAPTCDGGACYTAALTAPLPAHASCRVELGAGALDGTGHALAGGLIGSFDTAAAADDTPPAISAVSIQTAGPCLAVTFSTDEPATGTVELAAGDVTLPSPAGAGRTSFDVAIPIASLPPESPATIVVRAVDRAGNTAESAPLAWQTPAALPPLAITEVLANPLGPEPAQEWVELRNLGSDPVTTDGLSLADSRGADALPAATLDPGAYALVVTSTYDPGNGADPARAARGVHAAPARRLAPRRLPTASRTAARSCGSSSATRSSRATAAGSTSLRRRGRATPCNGSSRRRAIEKTPGITRRSSRPPVRVHPDPRLPAIRTAW